MARSGEARCDEKGKTSYGQPGDQTGNEVSIANLFDNPSKPWQKVFRAKSDATRQRLAQNMKDACENENIGYAQYGDGSTKYKDRYGLYFALQSGKSMKGVTIPCNCDCSSLVAECCIQSGVPVSIYMSTSNEVQSLRNTGLFDELTYQIGMKFMDGDIIWRNGHTGIIVDAEGKDYSKEPKWVAAATKYCNVYTTPSTTAQLLPRWPHLGVGNLVDVCDEDGDFWYVRIAAKYFGFVTKDSMSSPPGPEPIPFEEFTGEAIAETDLRQAPGTQYGYCNIDRNDGRGVRHTLYNGEQVPVVEENNNWYKVRIEGAQYTWFPWCDASTIVKVETKDPAVGDTIVLNTNQLNVSANDLEGKIEAINSDIYLITTSDGCKGYVTRDKFEVK